jgi:plasmid segregation protein ParM
MGYGFIKVDNGRGGYTFPSVVGESTAEPPMALGFRKVPITDDLRISVKGKSYFLGDLAVRHSVVAHRGLSPTRAEGDDLKILFLGSLSLFCQETLNDFYVVTGLPPGRMHMAADLIKRLRGEHEIVRQTGGKIATFTIRVDNIEVVPQPVGTYWSTVLDNRGHLKPDHPMLNGRVGIVDIGFRTSDYATIIDGDYSPAFSRTVPIGLSNAYDNIAAALATEYGLERETYTLDEAVISGRINVSGRQIDITGLRDSVFKDLATKLLVEARSFWQVEEYDHILLTGGGGQAMASYLQPHIPLAVLVEDPVTANARGYLAWGTHSALKRQVSRAAADVKPHERFASK